MKRYLDDLILKDLHRKMVIVTGPRQVGKTTLSKQLMPQFELAQYLNWDVAQDRRVLVDQAWRQDAGTRPGRALQWWLAQLEKPATRVALLERQAAR